MAAQFSMWDSWNAMWKYFFLFLACLFSHCIPGVSHGKLSGHHYFLSWREPWHKFEDWDWFNGRNFCRERCMDLVSFENPTEFRMFEEVMIAGKATMGSKSVWIFKFLNFWSGHIESKKKNIFEVNYVNVNYSVKNSTVDCKYLLFLQDFLL